MTSGEKNKILKLLKALIESLGQNLNVVITKQDVFKSVTDVKVYIEILDGYSTLQSFGANPGLKAFDVIIGIYNFQKTGGLLKLNDISDYLYNFLNDAQECNLAEFDAEVAGVQYNSATLSGFGIYVVSIADDRDIPTEDDSFRHEITISIQTS